MGLGEVERLKQTWDFTVDWRPFLLRPGTPDEGLPLPERIRAYMADPNNPLSTRARAMGLTMVTTRDVIPSTRRAHQAAEWARSQGRFDPFHHAVLERYWVRGENIHDFQVLRAAAVDAGLDGETLEREVASGRWKDAMEAGLAAAHEVGVNAVPTFIVGDRFVIQGAQDGRVFAQAFERLGHTPKPR
ncbi:MAG: DsbA family protein [Myxococcaceae bacterium]|nr:DsbA family protein [Myxococcaceae bacterium]